MVSGVGLPINMTKTVALAGSTGSIGTQAMDVALAEPDRFHVVAIGACRSVDTLIDQAQRLRPAVVALADERVAVAAELEERVPRGTEVRVGPEALASLASEADVTVNGVVGFAGLPVTVAALAAGKRLALANKESLIAAGPVVQQYRATPGAELTPVDSEHCAIHQCLRTGQRGEVAKLVLTASGGPFLGRSGHELDGITVEQALAHPTWVMGPKITVDSSTLMNKGLEVIEAVELFGSTYGLTIENVDVVVHPQSVVHSMVTWTDGATIAQLSRPDMRLPIAYALGYPERCKIPFGNIEWSMLSRLDFEPPDRANFACLDLAYAAGRDGGARPAQLSAANEVAVGAFLEGRLAWRAIPTVIEEALHLQSNAIPHTIEDVLIADAESRAVTLEVLEAQTA